MKEFNQELNLTPEKAERLNEYTELLEDVLLNMRKGVLLLYTEDKSLIYIPISRLFKVYKDNEMVYSGFDWIKATERYWRIG